MLLQLNIEINFINREKRKQVPVVKNVTIFAILVKKGIAANVFHIGLAPDLDKNIIRKIE